MSALDRAELLRLLPHRPPFLLLDRAEDFQPHRSLVGVKELAPDDAVFAGHFPGRPVMPGVLLVEAMAQTGAALTAKSEGLDVETETLMLAIVDSARFRAPVIPPASLRLHVEQTAARHGLYRYRGEALLDGRRVAETSFSARLVRSAPDASAQGASTKPGGGA